MNDVSETKEWISHCEETGRSVLHSQTVCFYPAVNVTNTAGLKERGAELRKESTGRELSDASMFCSRRVFTERFIIDRQIPIPSCRLPSGVFCVQNRPFCACGAGVR